MAIGRIQTEADLSAFVQERIDQVLARVTGPRPIATFTEPVTDAAFSRAPVPGTLGVDTASNRLYVKTAADTWKSVAVT